jgi:hypothetical protein
MLTLLFQAALHSLLLGAITGLGLKLKRIRDPQVEITVWKMVLTAAVAMPLLMRRYSRRDDELRLRRQPAL